MKIDGNIDRLPVWAQNKIRHLESVIASQATIISHLRDGDPESDTFGNVFGKEPQLLGRGVLIRFGSYDYNRPSFDVQFKDSRLSVRGSALTRDEMVILPSVSNAVEFAFVPRIR